MSVKVLEKEAPMKQGIVTILGSDCERNKASAAASIRRTLSADMSSKKWLEQNGFLSPMKKIVSSQVLVLPSDSEEEYEKIPRQDDVWSSIQASRERNEVQKTDVWGSILSHQKSENNSVLPPPYVHPLVKRSASTLSEKSLEICTESLGSETGSECFSSAEISSDGDEERENGERVVGEELKESNPFADLHVKKYKKSPVRPFPPPCPSISGGGDGGSLHMQSRRENGRLVLEAVSVPPRNYFQAKRQDGRLVLTLINTPPPMVVEEKKVEEFEKVFDNMEEVGDDIPAEEVAEDDGDGGYEEEFAVEQKLGSVTSGMIGVHKSGLVMKKLMAIGNKNPKWSDKFNKSVEEVVELSIPQSLPPPRAVARLIPSPAAPPLATAAASFNAYEYFWRNKSTVSTSFINPMITTPQPTHLKNKHSTTTTTAAAADNNMNCTKGYDHQDLVHLVPYLRGCKEPRRSLLIWEPYCIATS